MSHRHAKFIQLKGENSATVTICSELCINNERLDFLFSIGAIYQNGVRIIKPQQLSSQGLLKVFYSPRRFSKVSEAQLVFENHEYLVVDKPSGVPSVPIASNYIENVLKHFENQMSLKLFPAHRLDEATAGLIILAKTRQAVQKYHQLRPTNTFQKFYVALVSAKIAPQIYEHWGQKGKGRVIEDKSKTKNLMKLQVLKCVKAGLFYKVRMELLTGKTHQIRFQLSQLGAPIIGDNLYGDQNSKLPLQLLAETIVLESQTIKSRYLLDLK